MLILGLSNLFGTPGGIPAFNRLLVRSARAYAASAQMPLSVVVLADSLSTQVAGDVWRAEETKDAVTPASYIPCGGDRRLFARHLLSYLPRRPGLLLGHVNFSPLGLPFLAVGGRFGAIAHGTEVWVPLSPLRRFALQKARAVGCVSDHTASQVAQVQGVRRERCVRVQNALDPQRFEQVLVQQKEQKTRKTGDPIEVLSLTRLHPAEPKGIDLMIEAVAQVKEIRYTVAGEGEDRGRLEALAQRLAVADRVRFLGRVSDEERAQLLSQCDVFSLPSSGEGFGIVYLEAMAYGMPCIAARVGGAKEAVVDGETGLCIVPEVPPLVSALRKLSGDASLRAQMGEAGRAWVRVHFGYPQFRQRAENLFALIAPCGTRSA